MRISTVISSLTCGGAERVMSIICNALSELGHDVTVITLDDGRDIFYPLSQNVVHLPLDLHSASKNKFDALISNARRLRTLKRALRSSQPDVVLSFMDRTNVLTLMSGFRDAPIVVSERIHPDYHDIGPVWSKLRDVSYRRAARLVVQTDGVADAVKKHGRPISIIPNPIHVDSFPAWRGGELRIVAAGRLVEQKGFDRLIDSFEGLAPDFPDWRVEIYGDGPLRRALKEQIAARDLVDSVSIQPATSEFFDLLSTSEIFALPSRFEGFPNVLIEAMACGLPSVAFACPSGPADILSDAPENGTLVTLANTDEFSDALRRYMGDGDLRRTVGEEARRSVRALDVSENMKLWLAALGAP